MRRLVILASLVLCWLALVVACTTNTGTPGGIFGDRPLPEGEGEEDGGKDATTDSKDVGTDKGVDTSTPEEDAGEDI